VTTPFAPAVLEHWRRPHNHRRLDAPTHVREGSNPLCGDVVRMALRVEGGQVVEAAFEANACAICTAAASVLTVHLTQCPVADARALTDAALTAELGDVPAAREKCLRLPLDIVHAMLAGA
jgi:NifU-like protein involved in Fe-S cluster formation